MFDESLIERLTASTNTTDQKLAEYMQNSKAGAEHQETPDSLPAYRTRRPTVITDTDQEHEAQPQGTAMAWVVRHKLTWKHALTSATTTDELDAYEEAQTA